jgi:hypothetical protein
VSAARIREEANAVYVKSRAWSPLWITARTESPDFGFVPATTHRRSGSAKKKPPEGGFIAGIGHYYGAGHSATTGITASTALGGSGTAFKLVQPTIIFNYIIFAGG